MPARTSLPSPSTPVVELWNLSDKTAAWLNQVNIYTYSDLQSADLLSVWTQLKLKNYQVTKLMYYALWGAVNNCHWNKITDAEKAKITKYIASFDV